MGFIQPKRIQVKLLSPNLALALTWWSVSFPSSKQKMVGNTTTNLSADVYTFAKTSGLFGGVAFNGAGILKNDDYDHAYYGPDATPYAIVIERKFTNPNTKTLLDSLAPETVRWGARVCRGS